MPIQLTTVLPSAVWVASTWFVTALTEYVSSVSQQSRQEDSMLGDDSAAGGLDRPTEGKATTQEDKDKENEVIAYYIEQRRWSRSREWIGCLDATIRQLRRS